MDDKKAQEVEEVVARIEVRSKVRDLCGRCEEPIGKAKAARCDFAPYSGMRLHVSCIAALEAESIGEDGSK